MSDIDWIAVLRHLTAKNLAKYIIVIFLAGVAFITLSYYAAWAWGAS